MSGDDELSRLRKRVELLRSAIASRNELLAIVSHDIKSPLVSGAGLLSLLLRSKSENLTGRQRTMIETLERAANSQIALIESVSALSRIYRGKVEVNLAPVSAESLIETCAAALESAAADKGVNVVVRRGPEATLNVDRELTLEAFSLIVTNAVWFSPPETTVELSVDAGAGAAALVARDRGMGIEPDRLKSIFDLSQRTFTLGAREERGAGLGLQIARELTLLNGGRLEIESAPGEGTTVRLVFAIGPGGR